MRAAGCLFTREPQVRDLDDGRARLQFLANARASQRSPSFRAAHTSPVPAPESTGPRVEAEGLDGVGLRGQPAHHGPRQGAEHERLLRTRGTAGMRSSTARGASHCETVTRLPRVERKLRAARLLPDAVAGAELAERAGASSRCGPSTCSRGPARRRPLAPGVHGRRVPTIAPAPPGQNPTSSSVTFDARSYADLSFRLVLLRGGTRARCERGARDGRGRSRPRPSPPGGGRARPRGRAGGAGCSRRDRRPAGSAARPRTAPARAGPCTPGPCGVALPSVPRAAAREGDAQPRFRRRASAVSKASRSPAGGYAFLSQSSVGSSTTGAGPARALPRLGHLGLEGWRAAGSAGALVAGRRGRRSRGPGTPPPGGRSTAACETGWLEAKEQDDRTIVAAGAPRPRRLLPAAASAS